jgi:plasmid maintenance system antidote protein VapI
MLKKEHNTLEGIQKLVNVRASINTGLANELKKAFPKTTPATLNLESFIKNNDLYPE